MAKKWIKGAISHPGALTRKAKKAGESPMAFAHEHASDSGTTGKQARLAITLRGMHHADGGEVHSPGGVGHTTDHHNELGHKVGTQSTVAAEKAAGNRLARGGMVSDEHGPIRNSTRHGKEDW